MRTVGNISCVKRLTNWTVGVSLVNTSGNASAAAAAGNREDGDGRWLRRGDCRHRQGLISLEWRAGR